MMTDQQAIGGRSALALWSLPGGTRSQDCSAETIGLRLSEGVQRHLFTYAEIAQRVAEVSRPGKRGVSTLRTILATRNQESGRELNSYERMAKRLFRDASFPSAVSQHHIAVRGRSYFVDFAWPEHQLLVECDSMLAHSTPRWVNFHPYK